ncbi:hypothetical protein [Streptomyces sp. NPDC048659]|uniref:hypothetical protein n=1 Tax=Streptomyces sp. NPDC048659 TaxID=3155489 RepID=UPI00341432BE
MERATILRNLAASGAEHGDTRSIRVLSTELGLSTADLLVVAGRPVPAELLPPERDAQVLRGFAHRVSHCDHAQLAELESFARALPRAADPAPLRPLPWPGRRPAETGFAAVLGGLILNRGFGVRELPFLGLSHSTLHQMLWRWDPNRHRRQQLSAIAGTLGWTLPDIFAIADEPYAEDIRPMVHCHHLGRVFTAAIPLTTAQLIETARAADRLSAREDHGAWQPVSQGYVAECPDFA